MGSKARESAKATSLAFALLGFHHRLFGSRINGLKMKHPSLSVCLSVSVCVIACVRACEGVYVRACVRVCVYVFTCAGVVYEEYNILTIIISIIFEVLMSTFLLIWSSAVCRPLSTRYGCTEMAAVIITSLQRCHRARVEMTTPRCVRKRVKRFVSIYVKGPVLPG